MEKLAQFFKVKESGSTVKIELMAGLTTFMATAFTILAIPNMVAGAGGQAPDPSVVNAVFIAACFAATFGTFLKAFYAKMPFVQAPGMGLGSYFAGTVMGSMAMLAGAGYLPLIQQYQMALAFVFIAGVIFTLSTLFGIRDAIIEAIPKNIKLAMGAGIGLFITLLGLRFGWIVVGTPGTFVTLRSFQDLALRGHEYAPYAIRGNQALGGVLAIAGLLLIVILSIRKVRGALLIGVIVTAILAHVTGVVQAPADLSFNLAERFTDFINISFLQLDFSMFTTGAAWGTMISFVLAFFFVNMLDALGTIYGISMANGLVDDKGNALNLDRGLTADGVGTAMSGLFGTPTVTTVVSSASGISEGGRTGLTAATAGVLFFLALLLAPFVGLIPNVAVAPALIYVGFLMVSHVREIDFTDPTEAVPAFLTVVMMPLSFSIANGIAFGLISYIIIKLFTGRIKEVKPLAVIIAFLFILQYIL